MLMSRRKGSSIIVKSKYLVVFSLWSGSRYVVRDSSFYGF